MYILADDLGWNDVGYQSSDLDGFSPTLDHLANGGVRLTSFYALHQCTPARSALMSGFFPSSVGMGMDSQGAFTIDSPYGLPLSYPLMPEILANIGYETHMVGKWNIGHFAEAHRGIQVGDCHTGAYSTEIYAERLESIITAHDARGRPLFLYAAFQAIHAPADAPKGRRFGSVRRPRPAERHRRPVGRPRGNRERESPSRE